MEAFSALSNLASIAVVNLLNQSVVDPWKLKLLCNLRPMCPRLATIYIHGVLWPNSYDVCTVWTFEDEWTSTQVKSYDSVNGTWET